MTTNDDTLQAIHSAVESYAKGLPELRERTYALDYAKWYLEGRAAPGPGPSELDRDRRAVIETTVRELIEPLLFDGFKVVSSYSDAEAVDDGTLVAVTVKDRVTRALWEWLGEHLAEGCKPPDSWPVELFGWFRAGLIAREDALKKIAELGAEGAQREFKEMVRDRRLAAMTIGAITAYADRARRIHSENIGGGILELWVALGRASDKLYALFETKPAETYESRRLWLLPNEIGGLTLMFPEDY